MTVYCIFCRTQRCSAVARYLEESTGCRCISPTLIQRKWIQGQMLQDSHDYLPGYVFLYTDAPLTSKPWADGILRWLGEGPLCCGDLDFAMMLLAHDGVIGSVKALQEGDRIKLADPAWNGMKGEITKVDRNRKRCCVSFEFDGQKRSLWIGYDMLEDADQPPLTGVSPVTAT